MSRAHCQNCDLPVCAVGAEDPCRGCCACRDQCQGDAPDEVFDYYDEPCGIWGQGPCHPYGTEVDPVPTVYASHGEISLSGEYRLSFEDAEAYAERIMAAVRWERTRLAVKS